MMHAAPILIKAMMMAECNPNEYLIQFDKWFGVQNYLIKWMNDCVGRIACEVKAHDGRSNFISRAILE